MDEDLDARISLEAERAERELISGYIRDWLNKRLRSQFPNFESSVQWEDRAAVYGAWGRCIVDGRVFSVKISLRPEDVMDSSQTTREWSEFLDTQTDLLKKNLQSALWKAGWHPSQIPASAELQLAEDGRSSTMHPIERMTKESSARFFMRD